MGWAVSMAYWCMVSDEIQHIRSTAMPITDSKKRAIVILAGHPGEEKTWQEVNREAQGCMEEARAQVSGHSHRRGVFPTLRDGVSHGGGQTEPMNHSNHPKKAKILKNLNSQRCFRRIAGFGSCKLTRLSALGFNQLKSLVSAVFRTWAPKLYEYYDSTLGRLFKSNPMLRRPFNSIFTAVTYNLGPKTACFPHVDFANLAFGYCAITAIGEYDSELGGHLVLHDLELVIQFPAGSTILVPSAIIKHSNTAIRKGEKRYSFTQYCAGGLFRWVDNGCKAAKEYWASLNEGEKVARERSDKERWEFGLNLLPVLGDMKKIEKNT